MSSMPEPNAATLSYLKEYCDPKRRRDFAVLLDGPWGVGKTYFIKNFLKDYPRHLYISLYGISSTQQIDDELFRQLHPVLSSMPMQLIGRVAKGFLKGTVKIDLNSDGKDDGSASVSIPDLGLQKELSNPDGYLLVFDDLERCSLQISDALGYINTFVEHAGQKAILIANQNEIISRNSEEGVKHKRYNEIKEKLIGQTIKINSSLSSAYISFLDDIHNQKVKSFLRSHFYEVDSIHLQSKTNNLRLLKHALWDYERLAQYFHDVHWQNTEAMKSVLALTLAVSIEHRCGRLTDRKQIQRLMDGGLLRAMERQNRKDKSVEDEIEERYRTVKFDTNILNEEIIADAVIYGRVVESDVTDALKRSPIFAEPEEIPLWLRAWDYFDLTDEEAQQIADKFMKAFNERTFVERGIVFHAFGILRKYAELGLINIPVGDVTLACRNYVDDLEKSEKIEIILERSPTTDWSGSYAHHGFMCIDTPEFKEATAYYIAKSSDILERQYPQFIEQLLSDLEAGGNEFLLDLAHNNVHYSRFADKPILTAISPEDFLHRVLKMDPRKQRDAFATLNLRHRFPNGDALNSEKPWLVNMKAFLIAEISQAGPVASQRLQHYLEEYLSPIALS